MSDGDPSADGTEASIGREQQINPIEALTDAVDKHYDEEDCGAPLGDVVEEMLTVPSIEIGDVGYALQEAYFHGVIYQPSESTVARVAADGGTPDADRPDPEDDPAACSLCGVHIGAFGDEYCDGCAREIGVKPPLERCLHCGSRGPREQMESIDLSADDEYYPEIDYLCPSCTSDDDTSTEGSR